MPAHGKAPVPILGGNAVAFIVAGVAAALGLVIMTWVLARRTLERDIARRLSQALQLATRETLLHKKQLRMRRTELINPEHHRTTDRSDWSRELNSFCLGQIVPLLARQGLAGQWPVIEPAAVQLIEDAACEPSTALTDDDDDDGDPQVLEARMSSIDYESYCATILSDNGWAARLARDDQGARVLARKDGHVLTLRTILSDEPVDRDAVSDIATARQHDRANFAAIASNAAFTAAACQLAATNGVFLLHHDDLGSFSFSDFMRNLMLVLQDAHPSS